MTTKLRIGVIGLVHDHVWGVLEEVKKVENAIVTCVADVNKPLLAKAKERGIKTYESHADLLAEEKIDAVFVYTENSRHADVTELAAEKGLHVLVEKPMAATLAQASRMVRASKKYGVKLMVNYPTAWNANFREARRLANEGEVGRVYQVRYRAAHAGPKEIGCSPYFYDWLYNRDLNGAGAFMDYCCYGANICRWILGVPEKAVALGGTYVRDYLTVEDNAVLLMGYKKAMGISEASWSQVGEGVPPQYTLSINGSEGNMVAAKELRVFKPERRSWESIAVPPLEDGKRNAVEHFVSCIREDEPFDDVVSAELNRDAQAILEAGLMSMQQDRAVYLRELGSGE